MTTLITGGMGFIGLHTIKALVDAGERVVATYYQSYRPQAFIEDAMASGQLVFVQADVGEPGTLYDLLRSHHADGMVHLAIHGQASSDPGEDLRVNMDKLSIVLDAARMSGVKRLSMASNSAVYADLPAGPFTEDTLVPLTSRVQPGAFKKAWEVLAHNYATYAASADTEIVQMRISGVYGPLYTSMRNLASRLTHAAVHGTEPDLGPAAPFADDTNDFTYVKDVAEAIRAIQMASSLAHRVYCVASGGATTNAALLAAVKKVHPGFQTQLQPGTSATFKPDAFNDSTRLKTELGWQPRYDIEQGIAEYADWLASGNEF